MDSQLLKVRHHTLLELGFNKEPGYQIYSHKMFPDSLFRFENVDPDIFWTMDAIFKTCSQAGERKKAEAIRKELFIL